MENYAEHIERMLETELDDFMEKAARVLGTEFIQRVKEKTPIGEYSGGEYVEFTTNPKEKTKEVYFTTKDGKHVFFIAKNPPKAVKFKNKLAGKDGGTLMKAWTIKEIKKEPDGIRVVIFNPTDYASYVEHGHVIRNKKGGPAKGFVKGKHMLKHTEIEMTFESPEILRKAYEDFLNKVLR